jgi:phage tail sheath protein FI
MATPQLSPGVLVREVDLTVGRAENVLDNIGAIAGPFAIGPVDEAIDITTENELISVFGKPKNEDGQYEYWMSASSFLSYGGVLKVVRTDGENLVNANSALSGVSTDVGIGSTGLKIKNFDDYELNVSTSDSVAFTFAAKNPGSWANNLKVAIIDNKADQTLTVGIATTFAAIGRGVLTALTNQPSAGVGTTSVFNGYLKGIITGIGQSTIDVKITSLIDSNDEETEIEYAQRSQLKSFRPTNVVSIINSGGTPLTNATLPADGVLDWYDQQTISLTNTTIFWKSIAPKPSTNQYVLERNGKNDAMHVVVIDDTGSITGIQGNLLEKHVNISKAFDTVSAVNSPQKIFYKNYLAQFSNYIYAGDNISDGDIETVYPSGFSSGYVGLTTTEGLWNQNAQSVKFSSVGNLSYTLRGGKDYSGTNNVGGMVAQLGDLMTSYRLFSNKDEIAVDYLIMGPGLGAKIDSQAKAQELISIAEQRRDCLAVISPHKTDVVDVTNTDTQTDNIIEFFSPISSSSYAIFDSGYKYTYDRFNNRFRYIACNPDVAGLMVRTGILAYPWFSPAGQQRGILNNAIKLAYNPNKAQRDQLYTARVNAIVNQPGIGILLFGDKTALGYSSAFDRINVRRLFLTVEQALERAAQAQLFELNTQTTRANFVNIVEPYLRDVQSKNGVYDFLVICDQTNNTPDVIDNNEFRADIFLKPTRSINYITLTFVATRTGVSFEEVAGRV